MVKPPMDMLLYKFITLMTKAHFHFDLFYARDQALNYPAKPSVEWLTWFIRFVEGEGSFIVAQRGDVSVVVTQSLCNVPILYDIQKHLALGRVVLQSKTLKSAR
jgi:hypothetical protein